MCLDSIIDKNGIRPVQEVEAYPLPQGAGDKDCWSPVGSTSSHQCWRAVWAWSTITANSFRTCLPWMNHYMSTNKHVNKKPIRSFFCHLITCLEDFQNERLSSHMLSLNPNKCKSLLKRFLPTIVNGWISTGWYNSFLKLLGRPSCVIVYSYVVKCILLLPRKKMSV